MMAKIRLNTFAVNTRSADSCFATRLRLCVCITMMLLQHVASFLPVQNNLVFHNRQRSCYHAKDRSRRGVLNALQDLETSTKEGNTVVVVGAGVGGLAIACRLASSDELHPSTKIIIVEKNTKDMVGGRCGSFYRDIEGLGSFRHERGPSLLLLKDVYLGLFNDCNMRAEDFGLEIKQCVPAYQVVFEDGDSIFLGFPADAGDSVKLAEQQSREKMNLYESDGAMKWDEYMQSTEAFLDCGLPNFIEERLDLPSVPSFLREALKDGLKAWPLKPHSAVLDATFDSEKMKALASFQDLYVGLEPHANEKQIFGGVVRKTAPAVFGLLAALELHPTNKRAGVHAPIGGFQAVSNAFEGLAKECGVEIQYNKSITSISEDGVWINDEKDQKSFLPADLVICNADLPFATKTLVNKEASAPPQYDWDDRFDYSSGVIAFHWSLNKPFDCLNTHNVFLMDRKNEASWGVLRLNDPSIPSFEDEQHPFNFYVHRAGKVDPTAAPEGCDSIMVLVPCCTLQRDKKLAKLSREDTISGYSEQFNEVLIHKVRASVLDRLSVLSGLEGLKDNIVDEVVDTPATYADDFNLAAGTPFALSHGFGQLSLTRPAQQSKELDNTLFVGASTRPGNGVPLVLLGAKQVAQKAVEKLKNKIQL